MQAIIIVKQLPPKDFFNKDVNLESRYGMKLFFFCSEVYSSNFITFLSTNKDLLI